MLKKKFLEIRIELDLKAEKEEINVLHSKFAYRLEQSKLHTRIKGLEETTNRELKMLI